MTDPVIWGLRRDLHSETLGQKDSLLCDYHDSPASVSIDDPVLFECIRVIDPELDGYHEDEEWEIDVVRCSDCAITSIEEPTYGYEEALVQLSVAVSDDVVSITAPEQEDVTVLEFSSAADGCRPMIVDEHLHKEIETDDHSLGRWSRVCELLEMDLSEPLQEHIASLIEQSPETPFE